MASNWSVWLGDYVDDIEDVDAALGGEIFAADEGRADDDKFLSFSGLVLGYCERHSFDAEDGFGGF